MAEQALTMDVCTILYVRFECPALRTLALPNSKVCGSSCARVQTSGGMIQHPGCAWLCAGCNRLLEPSLDAWLPQLPQLKRLDVSQVTSFNLNVLQDVRPLCRLLPPTAAHEGCMRACWSTP